MRNIVVRQGRRGAILGWALVGIYIILATAGLILLFQPGMPIGPFNHSWEAALQAAGILVIAIIGGLIISRHPRHPLGWVMVLVSILLGLDLFAFSYAAYGLVVSSGSLPGALGMAVVADDVVFIAQIGLVLALFLFPDGRFLTARWRTAVWVLIILTILTNITWLLTPGPLSELPGVNNPIAVSPALYDTLQPFASIVSNILIPLFLLAGILTLFLRYRGGDQVQKQQIKWFIFGMTPFVLGAAIQLIFQISSTFASVAFITVGLVTSPLAIALAIFKYRLYDIDFIINRTLVYTLLTSSIAILYGVVVGASGLLMQTGSNLAGLIITGVIVLVVFRPFYSTLQRGVNRIIPENHSPPVQSISDKDFPAPTTTSSVNWPLFARIVWVILAVMAIVIIVAALPRYAAKFGGQLEHATGVTQPPGAHFFAAASGVASLVSALLSLGLSAVLFRQKFSEPMAMLLSFFLLIYGIAMGGPLEAAASYWLGSASHAATFQAFLMATPLVALLLLFPNGRFVPRWTRWALLLTLPWNVGLLFLAPFDAENFNRSPFISFLVIALFVSFGIIGTYAQIYRYLRAATNNERQQIRWAIYGFALWLTYALISSIPYYYLTALPSDAPTPWWGPASELGWWLSLNILPVCLTIAITRYQLWDIDLVINRTLVYGTLTISVAIFYGIIVSITGYLLQTDNNLASILFTIAIAVIFFRPLRRYIQGGVNFLVRPAADIKSAGTVSEISVAASVSWESQEEVITWPVSANLPLIGTVCLLIGLVLAFLWVRLAVPFADDRVPPENKISAISVRGVAVTPLTNGLEGLQVGDVVTALNGRSFDSWPRIDAWFSDWQIGDNVTYTVIRQGITTDVSVTLKPYPLSAILRQEWGFVLFQILFLLLAAIVFVRRPHLLAARVLLLAAAAQFSASPWLFGLHASDFMNAIGFWLYNLTSTVGFLLAFIANFHFALVFSQPVGFIYRKRWFVPLMYGLPILLLVLYGMLIRPSVVNPLDWLVKWNTFVLPLVAFFLFLTVGAILWQYHRSEGVQRQQLSWIGLAFLIIGPVMVPVFLWPVISGGQIPNTNLMALIALVLPLALTISILRYNLFDIDTLLNRALVYGGLTAVIIVLYVFVVGILGTILQAQGNVVVALIATGLAALLFQPMRDRLQRTVNRFIYGERDEPFEVLARLGERLENTLSPEMVYPTIVETVSQALKLPYAAVNVWQNGRWETAESYGKPVNDPVIYPLNYQGETVGQLLVARRTPGEAFGQADERILRNIARQAGAAVHAAQLVADLQQSRHQLVTAREEERRRLRRDLHDGLGPHLASQTLTIDAIEKLLDRDPERARVLLQDLKMQSQTAVKDIRRVVYNLRPPALDELGLIGALNEGAARQSQNGLRVTVDAPPQLPPLPAAVEVAAYRVAQEAVTNVVRHAQAHYCVVRLGLEPPGKKTRMRVEVEDDGQGLPSDYLAGVGFQSMRERAAELGGSCHIESVNGGGVCVTAVFPLTTI